jgi:UDP-N-acetylmuramoylalanine--D-glutamate ligase
MVYKNKKFLVCGMARSGQASARLLKQLDADVTAQDLKETDKLEWTFSPEEEGIDTYLGKNPDDIIGNFDAVIVSPGIPSNLPFIEKARELNIPVWGEIELAYRLCPCPIIAITGTNGKTTVTTLVGEIMRKSGKPTAVAGNIGNPFTGQILGLTPDHIVVAEVSSFQLETVADFRPHISAVLNITPDHLNRHKTMENYKSMKERIFSRQGTGDFTVLNGSDSYCKTMKPRCNVVWFDKLLINLPSTRVLPENALAAAAIARCAGVPDDIIIETITHFKGVEHRLEYVTAINGVTYYNDSKATNTASAIKALEAMKRPVILIGGGYDKETAFDSWVKAFAGKVKSLIVMGETAEAIINTCRAYNFPYYERVNSLRDAVNLAAVRGIPGDVVLLSPACASWDMFDDFEQRGNLFKQFVLDLMN